MATSLKGIPILGWNEMAALPGLGVECIRCKVDTGARTSALHAFYVEEYEEKGIQRVRFGLHPDQGSTDTEVHCVSDILEKRNVTDSGGHTDERIVIETQVVVGSFQWPIEITLTNRDTMRFRMLLGRMAIVDNFMVDPAIQLQMGKPSADPKNLPYVSLRHDEEE